MKLIFVRHGSAIMFSEFGERPVKIGDVVALGANTLCGSEPEGSITITTLYLGVGAGEVLRLTRRGILLGISLSQLITLATGILSIVGALYYGGGILLAYTAPVWVVAAALTWIPIPGRPAVEWLPVAFWWLWRSTGAGSSSPARCTRSA